MTLDEMRGARHDHRGNRVLKNQLLLIVGVQNHRVLIERANAACKLHAAQQVDGDDTLIFASRIEKGILYVLCWLVFHGWSSLQPAKTAQPQRPWPLKVSGSVDSSPRRTRQNDAVCGRVKSSSFTIS